MKTGLKFHQKLLANLNTELLYAVGSGNKERQEWLEVQIKKIKEKINALIQNDK